MNCDTIVIYNADPANRETSETVEMLARRYRDRDLFLIAANDLSHSIASD